MALLPVHVEETPRWWPAARLLLALSLLILPALLLLPPVLKLPVYSVQGGTLTARSLGARVVIPPGTPVQSQAITLHGKLIGSVLPGYTVGLFRTSTGRAQVFSDGSQGRSALVFATRTPTVLTPIDPQALLRAWQAGENGIFRPARPARPDWTLLLLLPLVPITILLLARPRLTYRLDGDTLTVQTAATTLRFPRHDARAALTHTPLGTRLFGTATPGYYTGTFISHAGTGGKIQAAAGAARPGQAVILTHRDREYYLTPTDPQALIDWFSTGTVPPAVRLAGR
ncbi:PH domain-containing protein [Deinococcus aquaticus]|uniref:PH domain-containing protein n=1 Tax=Deinococcus aquaticus TaxID=328692 RepID=UPI003F44D51D